MEGMTGTSVCLNVDSEASSNLIWDVPKVKDKIYRVGIIGCGWIATRAPDNHFDAYCSNPRTKVVALSDLEYLKYAFFTTIKGYLSYMEMVCTEKPDIVSVCTPVETHSKIICDIANLPFIRAIYLEKPISDNIEDAEKMVETCHKHNVLLQINHQRRFIRPKFRFSRDFLDTGTHAFDRIRQLFGDAIQVKPPYLETESGIKIEVEYIPTMDEHIFELDCVRSKEKMIPLGVQHLVECLDEGKESISSGEEALKTLRLLLEYQAKMK